MGRRSDEDAERAAGLGGQGQGTSAEEAGRGRSTPARDAGLGLRGDKRLRAAALGGSGVGDEEVALGGCVGWVDRFGI